MFFSDCRHVAALILPDLRFEWILSVCMVFALGAVFAPLFILLGLQQGIVGNMVDRLQRDPISRLVTPKFSLNAPLADTFLEGLKKRATVVIPSAEARLLLNVEGRTDPVNTVPTLAEDPLLVENGILLPAGGDDLIAVVSDRLSRQIRKGVGDPFRLVLVRDIGETERVPIRFRVAGVLPPEMAANAKIWLPLEVFHGITRWRRGGAVPKLGLSGAGTVLAPEFDGILAMLPSAPTPDEYRIMLGALGFSEPPRPISGPGWIILPDRVLQLWSPRDNQVFPSDFSSLVYRHEELGYPVTVVPYLDDFFVRLESVDQSVELKVTVLPGETEPIPKVPDDAVPVRVAPGSEFLFGAKGTLIMGAGPSGRTLRIPVRIAVSPRLAPGHVAVPQEFAGKMNAARRQPAAYDPAAREFRPVFKGNHFFRAYASSINALEPLVSYIRDEGEKQGERGLREPVSQLNAVRNIRRLASYMETLYLLIAGVAGVSGFFAITANVYAGVQRKRRDLAYLQLLGVHRGTLFLFPYLKSLLLILAGILLAILAYGVFGYTADRFFAGAMEDAASLTRLGPVHLSLLLAGIVGIGSVASLLAALTITRIEPGEFIRE